MNIPSTAGRTGILGYPRQMIAALTVRERRRTALMFATIVLLHVVGFAVFILFVVPGHYKGLGIGIAVLAYSLGVRHAFDADHISAIDNTIRKLMAEGRRPLSVGFWFSLGHSTIVVAIGVSIVVAEKAVYSAVSNNNSTLEQFGAVFGTIVSASFLFLIALLNVGILLGILKVFRAMRHGNYDEPELERQLHNRGFMNRFFGRWTNTIDKEWKMYPLGVVFGLGFDTATEVTLLATTALLASQSLPFYAILCLPVLFTAGMTLMDTLDGIFMNFAYSWAFFNPVRKVYYNLAITGLSVGICFVIGGIEVLGLVGQQWGALHGAFWDYMAGFDINRAGFVIAGLFIAFWAAALAFWKFGRIEQKWSARLRSQSLPDAVGPADGDTIS